MAIQNEDITLLLDSDTRAFDEKINKITSVELNKL